ncbi:hypothetical protein [Brevundimonas abyssalis]|uniref:hypothetical protein n=1 Tax=Brevundimonas abyssalis TaxID=1125965 RepID=UPI00277D0BD1|nr:hypothetical protein [Brevundimonas abyssalis]
MRLSIIAAAVLFAATPVMAQDATPAPAAAASPPESDWRTVRRRTCWSSTPIGAASWWRCRPWPRRGMWSACVCWPATASMTVWSGTG